MSVQPIHGNELASVSLPLPLLLPNSVRQSTIPFTDVTYSGWRLTQLSEKKDQTIYAAFKADDVEHSYPAVTLKSSQTVFCEGFWPFRPSYAPRVILSGVCLYTAAWSLSFASAADNGDEPRPLSLGLPGDLARILKLLKKGRPIVSVQLPTLPALYHRRLINWQAEVLQRFPSVEVIRYTVPVHDYRGYIMQVEGAVGHPLPGLHQALDGYMRTIQAYMELAWGDFTQRVQFDTLGSPEYKKADATSRENDMQLYLRAVQDERVMGMEDLPEVALAHEVARRTNVMIPCAVAVLGIPDPYLLREDACCACQTLPFAALS